MARPSRLSHRLRWGIGDQVLSSLTSLFLAVVVAGSVGVRSFGVFGVAISGYVIAVLVARAIVGEPLGIRHSGSAPEVARRALAGASGAALMLGVLFAALTLLTAIVLRGSLGRPLAALAVSLPGLVLQDAWRYGFIAVGHPVKAVANDLVLAVAQGVAIAWLIVAHDPSVAVLVLAWGGAATLASAVGCIQAGVVPVPWLARRWLSCHRDLWPRLLVEAAAMTGTWQLTMMLVGTVAGLETIGALRGAQTLLGPLNLAFLAVPLVALPELSRLGADRRPAVLRAAAALGAGLAVLSLLAGLMVWMIPDRLGQQLLGASLQPARSVLLPYAIFLASTGVNIAAIVGLRSTGAADRSLRVRLGMAPVLLSAGLLGAVVNGAVGAAVGLALANWLAAGVWWGQLTAHAATGRRPWPFFRA